MAETNADPKEPLTLGKVLELGTATLRGRGFEQPALEMGLMLAEVIGGARLDVYVQHDRPLDARETARARALLARRMQHEPMAYILGRREFHGLEFEVNPHVLVPRPETEVLVEAALGWASRRDARTTMADIGTGSGAIAVACAHAMKTMRWIATDISNEALDVARRNAQRHGVAERIDFRQGDLLAPLAEPVDAIISNPPYIDPDDAPTLAPDVRRWEPRAALFSEEYGLAHHRRLIEAAPPWLRSGGLLAMECGMGQAPRLIERAGATGAWKGMRALKDLQGIERVVMFVRGE